MARSRRGTFLKFFNGEPSDIVEGQVVAISKSSGDTVVRAKADDADRMPAIGFVRKASASRVIVQVDAVYVWPAAASVTVGAGTEYWVGTTAGLITDDPSTISSGSLQIVGIGKKSPHHIFVRMDPLGINL